MHEVISDLEKRFLPHLESLKTRLEAVYPNYRLRVWSSSTGSRTEYQGHDLGLECIFPDAADEESDCVALMIGVKHLTTEPLLCNASVGWGQGASPDAQVELVADPVRYSEATAGDVESRISELVRVFEVAVSSWQGFHARA
jgi:hypothetical protein